MRFHLLTTPTGPFALIEDATGLRTTWVTGPHEECLAGGDAWPEPPPVGRQLAAYFDGDNVDFSHVDLPEGPAFLRACWDACRRIPRGSTITYTQLARRAGGTSGAARAAGQAMRRNPLPVIVPCHRVTASGGRLGGFSGESDPAAPSLAIKTWLLAHEGALPMLNLPTAPVVQA